MYMRTIKGSNNDPRGIPLHVSQWRRTFINEFLNIYK